MPEKVVSTPYPLIDADPHFARVVRYMRPSDYAWWGALTAAFPGLLYGWRLSISFFMLILSCSGTDAIYSSLLQNGLILCLSNME